MYRDSANALDEHDRAVGAILIGEALIDECERARQVTGRPSIEHTERWRTLTDVHNTYFEVWRHLDRARSLLANRGANTASYDERRPQVRRAATSADGTQIDKAAIDDARRAVEDLKLAVPGADWAAIRSRTTDLAHGRLARARGQRTLLFALLALFATAIAVWLISIIPEHKLGRREAMRRELAQVVTQRQVRIASLMFEIGAQCDVDRARELAKLLAMDGRAPEARLFGDSYSARCGEDAVVTRWAHAPDPRRHVQTGF